jgi:ribulose-phosphate 3-epimerase
MVAISASILSTDLTNVKQTLQVLEKSGVDMLHIDVMDGKFVPNITIGHSFIAAIKQSTSLPLDVHLMIESPEKHIEKFAEISDILTIHYEATTHVDQVLRKIKSCRIKVGIALVPSTHESVLEYLYDIVDRILVMSVNPGSGGQTFIESQIAKIQCIHDILVTRQQDGQIELAVDGGINKKNSKLAIHAGANVLAVGSRLFDKGLPGVQDQVAELRRF